MSFSWIDIVIVVILAICIIEGGFKGFIKGFLSLFSLIASFIIARLTYIPISKLIIENTDIYNFIYKNLSGSSVEESTLNLIVDENNTFADFIVNFTQSQGGSITDPFLANISYLIVTILTFIVILLVSYIIISILVNVLDAISKLPVVSFFNKIGGVLFGVVKGMLINFIFIGTLYVVLVTFNPPGLEVAINASKLMFLFQGLFILL